MEKNKLKILFINPNYSMKALYGGLAGSGNELPPQSLAVLAAVTKQRGYETAILDCAVMKMTTSDIIKKIYEFSPNYVGITSTTVIAENAGYISSEIKKVLPSAKIILGGPHITALPKETLEKFLTIDVGVIGEGEETLIELLDSIHNGRLLKEIPGIAFRDIDGKIVVTPQRGFITNIDVLPLPAWELLPPINKFYDSPGDSINRTPAIGLTTSRGCPGRCIFCDKITFGNKFRAHSAEYLLKMIKEVVLLYGVKEIYFMDDYFMASKKRLIDICNALIEAKLDLTWTCTGRITKKIDRELLTLMKKAGCWQICYGIESGSQGILDIIKKDIKIEDIEACVKITREMGLAVKGFFMLGNFKENMQTVKETIDFIRRLPLTEFHMCYFVPFPGSEAYELASEFGTFNNSWSNMTLFVPNCFIPKDLTAKKIKKIFKACYRAHYLKPSVIFYFMKKAKNPLVFKKLLRSFFAFLYFSFFSKE